MHRPFSDCDEATVGVVVVVVVPDGGIGGTNRVPCAVIINPPWFMLGIALSGAVAELFGTTVEGAVVAVVDMSASWLLESAVVIW